MVDRDVGELELADEHGGSLDEREPGRVEEDVLVVLLLALVGVLGVVVKHDVEAEAERSKEEGVPENRGCNGAPITL